MKLTDGEGVNQVFDCSVVPETFQSASSFLKPRGQVVVINASLAEAKLAPWTNVTVGEFQFQGSKGYDDTVGLGFPIVINYLKRGVQPFKELITSKIKLNDLEQALKRLVEPGHAELKVVVSPE